MKMKKRVLKNYSIKNKQIYFKYKQQKKSDKLKLRKKNVKVFIW